MHKRKNSFSSHWFHDPLIKSPKCFDNQSILYWVHYKSAPYIWTTINLQEKYNMEILFWFKIY